MQDGITFIEPTWLRIHQVLQIPARNGAEPVLDRLRPYLTDGTRLKWIAHCVRVAYGHKLIHSRQAELNGKFSRKRRANFYQLRLSRKAWLLNPELIIAESESLHIKLALIAGRECVVVLIGAAGDLDGGSYAEAGGVGYTNVQLTLVDLTEKRRSNEE
jgi:hypothetical protein